MKPSLQLRLSQQLTMTPQLQQAIRLLQLPVMELQTQIHDALEQNIMLEVEEPAAAEAPEVAESEEPNEVAEVAAEEPDWDEVQRTGPADTVRSSDSNLTFEQADRTEETLKDHLLWQLELENLDSRTTTIGQAIIDAINEDGYVNDDLEEIRATLAPDVLTTTDEIEEVLRVVQNFDPVGVAARSVSECVLLQLNQLDRATPGIELAEKIAGNHLELVADHQYSQLRRVLQSSEDEIDEALALVRACHPRPGSAIYASAAEYVVPDVFVRKIDGTWTVELNGSLAPRLKVNDLYAGSLGRGGEYDALKVQLQEARWLIRSLEIRNETLLKVAHTIVQRQTEFLEHGDEHMRPMVLRDIAEAIEMHESTVSRVTTNKFMHTPRGVFEFRYFFSSHVAGDEGEQSSIAVRAKIRKLISGENPTKPMSDNQIAKLLSEDGVKIARRTIAKYREAMNIPSSSERRKTNLAS
ncbi:MAG TPA: RNA polymerase factor sigma-54 [Gammaproteobacteria bacterium]|nr:RNA polymerase factor sigma-54 [Gammaproteobacteria bacterium]